MRALKLFLISLLILACWTTASAQGETSPKPGPVILTDEQDEYPLGLHLEILEDPGGELTIEEVDSSELDSQFTPNTAEVPNFGFTGSVYWVRLKVQNESQMNDSWLLEQGFANTHFVDLYTPLPDGAGYEVRRTGVLRQPTTRDVNYPRIVFNLTIPADDQQLYYLRFESGASMTLPLTLWTEAAFFDQASKEQIFYGVFYGVLLGLLFFNLFLVISVRDVSYLFFVILLALFIIEEASYDGLLALYVIPNFDFLKANSQQWSFTLLIMSVILFSDSFLDLRSRNSRLHRISLATLAIGGLFLLLTPFVNYYLIATFVAPWAVLSLVLVFISGMTSWLRGYLPARFFMIAWLGMIISIIWVLLIRLGYIPSTMLGENAYRVGAIWMAVFWSFALADRINLLKAETDDASRELLRSEHKLSEILEGLPLGVTVYGSDYKPTYVNRRAYEILADPTRGIEPDLAANRTLSEAIEYYSLLVADSDQEYPMETMPVHRALQGEPAYADDIEVDAVDHRIPLEVWASPVRDDTGNVESAVVAFQDVTDRKQVEKELRASEKKFRVIVENNFEGIIFMAQDRTLSYVSPSYERLIGRKPEEMMGQSRIVFVHPDDRARIAEVFQEVLQHPGKIFRDEYRIRHLDGSWVWIETNAMNLLDDPSVQAVVLNSRDITERKWAETELAEYRKSLEQLVEERTEELSRTNELLGSEIIEREKLEKILQQHIQWLTKLSQVRQTMAGSADLQVACQELSSWIYQLLDAHGVYLVYWDNRGDPVEFSSCRQQEESEYPLEDLGSVLKKTDHLWIELVAGNAIHFSADQTAEVPEPLQEYFQQNGFRSLLLEPLVTRRSVEGLFAVALPLTLAELSFAQLELMEAMTHDMADISYDARLLDRARALIAAEERTRLARDLHDSVTQVLFSASLVAEVLPRIWQRDPEKALESLAELRRLTRGALAEMRTMLLELRPAAVIKTPLDELLAQLTEAVTSRVELTVQLFVEPIPPLPDEVHTSFYRIAQEALNNVVKHAQASLLRVRLSAEISPESVGTGWINDSDSLHLIRAKSTLPDPGGAEIGEVRLVIEDDGVGFSPEIGRQTHLGLGIMEERADAIQANLIIDSRPGGGTTVALSWNGPLKNE